MPAQPAPLQAPKQAPNSRRVPNHPGCHRVTGPLSAGSGSPGIHPVGRRPRGYQVGDHSSQVLRLLLKECGKQYALRRRFTPGSVGLRVCVSFSRLSRHALYSHISDLNNRDLSAWLNPRSVKTRQIPSRVSRAPYRSCAKACPRHRPAIRSSTTSTRRQGSAPPLRALDTMPTPWRLRYRFDAQSVAA